ncbi:LCP family protein required for cell wall assembly [Desulfohalotomaculum tongense]|uniref:LCP family protein n=1 Tax=Desulforadius tongensis TaxID=1216062 RepID=UPI001957F592|nr:LCP family protein [Desulforadius tongensis]MBM7854769.1 LCP family protein required for cell wall assembly [Desulforadius tongensis]
MVQYRNTGLKHKLPVIVVLVMVVLFAAGYAVAGEMLFPQPVQNAGPPEKKTEEYKKDLEPQVVELPKEQVTFLVLGMDARPGEIKTRTDTMLFVSVNKKTSRIAVMSIPRDTRVQIPGAGYDKINNAHVYGGPELARKTVSQLLGVSIDHYVVVNFAGFKEVVDAVGGVDMYVEQNMNYYDQADGTHINLKKGQQHLDGEKALQYVRFRSYPRGDIDRVEHQQKFFKALVVKTLQPGTVTKLPELVSSIRKAVNTDLSLKDMLTLAYAARNFSSAEIISQTLPGRFMNYSGISYWYVQQEKAAAAVLALLDGKKTPVFQGSP